VDDAPFTGDLDLDAALTREQLAEHLRIVHLRADRPSLRALAIRTRHDATPLSKTTVSEMLNGSRFPRKAVMIAFLQACGLSDARTEPWRRAWERIATTGSAQTGSPSGHTTNIQQPSSENKPARGARDGFPAVIPADLEPTSHSAGPAARNQSTVSREARNPVTCRRELGAALRALRLNGGLTAEEVAERLLCSASKVSRMENGHGATLRDIRDLCGLYGVPDDKERDRLMELARRGRQQAWWQPFDLPFGDYLGLEEDATSIKAFHCGLIPGLLQTGPYAAAIERSALALSLASGKEGNEYIRARVEMRLTRQRILTRDDPPRYHTIIDEAVLH
jgi:transcriptional regulator with XRE-family HTH domain